jgi:uncharacterized protein YecT (DUF1311 family)
MSVRHRAAAIVVALTAPVALAAEPPEACEMAMTTAAMVRCAGQDLERAERTLDLLLEERRANADPQARRLLDTAQAAWAGYAEAECRRQRDAARGGTIAPLLEIGCRHALTEVRVRQLAEPALGEGPPLSGEGEAVYWSPDVAHVETFDCTTPEVARLGLVAGRDEAGRPTLAVRVAIGAQHLDFPVGGETQASLYAATVRLSVETAPDAPCATLVLDDGYTDRIRISWDKGDEAYRWSRR